MFGKNPIRKQDLSADGALWVQEIFPTIQGEGPYAGEPAVFLRLGGCNLRCWFCDTDFESGDKHPMKPDFLSRRLRDRCDSREVSTKLIVITGGEPMRQNILPLIEAVNAMGLQVQIETAGTLWVPGLEKFLQHTHARAVDLVCSPKTGRVNPMIEHYCLHYKYIVSTRFSINWELGVPRNQTQQKDSARKEAPLYFPTNGAARVWLQPCDEYDESLNRANRDLTARLAMRYGHRLSLQQHKVLNLP